jgi:hypothetical protein
MRPNAVADEQHAVREEHSVRAAFSKPATLTLFSRRLSPVRMLKHRCSPISPRKHATRRESGPILLTSGWRLNSDAIIDGSAQPLLAAQIPLSGLHTNMSQQELNLLKLSTRQVAKSRTGTPEVVRSQLLDAHPGCKLLDSAPYDLFCDATTPD